jgi:hypothetical protein
MFNSTSAFTLVGAVIGASAYAKPLPAAAQEPIPLQAVAGQQLRASGAHVSPQTLAVLDEAAWLARRDKHVLAERSLDDVLNQIAVGAGRS